MGSEVSSHALGNTTTHGVVRRRDSDDSVGEERSRTPLEPLAKRVRRTESGVTTITVQSVSNPRTPTLEPPSRSPFCPTTSDPWSLSVAHETRRSSSDMILESDNGATPPPSSEKEGAAGENTIHDNDTLFSERKPFAETTSELRAETPTAEFRENRVTEEAPMLPVQDLYLASPGMEPNPFTETRTFLCPRGLLPQPMRSAMIPDVGRLSLHSPTVYDAHSTVASQAPRQGSPTQKAYIFSAAEIRTLVASRGSDEGSSPNKLVFSLDWGFMNGITKWRNFKAGQG